jgi:hypothetical protein
MNQITISTSPDDGLPTIVLDHRLYGTHEVNMPHVSLRDPDDVRLAAEVSLDLLDGALDDVDVVDARAQ